MNKVSAVEKIIRDLHGPIGATLALTKAGMTASLASFSRADASMQTDPSSCKTSTAASPAKQLLVLPHQSNWRVSPTETRHCAW